MYQVDEQSISGVSSNLISEFQTPEYAPANDAASAVNNAVYSEEEASTEFPGGNSVATQLGIFRLEVVL